jgi:hypothetical protein
MELPPPIPTSTPPPPLPSAKRAPNSIRQAALFSVWAPFIGMGVNIFVQAPLRGNRMALAIVGGTAMLLIFSGFIAGIVALVGTKKHGKEGIFGRAIAGICINGVLMALMLLSIPGLMKAAQRAKAAQQKRAQEEQALAQSGQTAAKTISLAEARRGIHPALSRKIKDGEPASQPPEGVFNLIKYSSNIGEMAAYVSPSPSDGERHPAIIWLFGGFSNGIGEIAWEELPPDNDQSGSAFRKAGIVMMYPSLRGGNDNPGFVESFYGEVDDVLAARDYLATLEYVDPARIYLGGHSTGGTLALLVAESSENFRAIFSFGPVENVAGYGEEHLSFALSDRVGVKLRAPVLWLGAISRPTFVFEGTKSPGNIDSLQALSRASRNPMLHFHPVKNGTHFSVLAPTTSLVAAKILEDKEGNSSNIKFSERELSISGKK